MPVSSPYAVFRAADLNWPPRIPLPAAAGQARPDPTPLARKRRRSLASEGVASPAERVVACIQGDLFQIGLCC